MRLKGLLFMAALTAPLFLFETNTGCSYTAPLPAADSNSYECACTCNPELSHHFTRRVNANEDDSEQQLNDAILLNSDDLDFQNGRLVGLRFRDVPLPPGAMIESANVQFTASAASNAGTLTVEIAAEANANPAPFTATLNDLAARSKTGSPVEWNLDAAWALNSPQTTPNFASVLQQVVVLPGWAEGNDIVVLITGVSGTAVRRAFSHDGRLDAVARLTVEYQEPVTPLVGPLSLQVCMLPEDNENLGGTAPDDARLLQDCRSRVETTVGGLADACGYPPICTCAVTPDSRRYADKCDVPCAGEPVDAQCSNFDPVGGNVTATHAGSDEPVCIATSPLSSAMYGRRTTCAVDGHAFIEVEDELKIPAAAGIVKFVGPACPDESCAIGTEYNLDIDSITFGNFLKSATFSDLGSLGASRAGNETMVSEFGDGTYSPNAFDVSGQGRRGDDKRGLATTNDDDVDIVVLWGGSFPFCGVRGTVLGAVDPELRRCENAGPSAGMECEDDSECTDDPDCSDGDCNCEDVPDSDIQLSLNVSGEILNHPPRADAGLDQEIECATAAVNDAVLDGSASGDLDSNIALYSWFRGSRVGEEVGIDPTALVEQALGSETYVLRVIDDFGEADEDQVEVAVVDTVPPVVTCAVTASTLNLTNHSLPNVGLSGTAVDSCEGELAVEVKVYSDEDDEENTGDGTHSPDAKDLDLGTLRLRAERKGNGDGRVYLVVNEAFDSSGNRGASCCAVTVPSSNMRSAQTSAAAQAAAALAYCQENGTAPPGYFVIGDGAVLGPKQ